MEAIKVSQLKLSIYVTNDCDSLTCVRTRAGLAACVVQSAATHKHVSNTTSNAKLSDPASEQQRRNKQTDKQTLNYEQQNKSKQVYTTEASHGALKHTDLRLDKDDGTNQEG